MADIVAPPTDQLPTEQTLPATPDTATATVADTAPRPGRESAPVAHTPGGWPAAPLALLSANTAVAGAAAAALTTGPLLALLAAGGTTTALAVGSRVRRRNDRRRTPNTNGRAAGQRAEGLLPRRGRAANGGTGAGGRRTPLGRRNVNPRTG
ncbi:hypothetical protein, partial [Streptacidiphilus anmyonensis]|uniref:hypothetical protein n=1 Tax=Streptacidiphilus anmyonensis TaxID=405782 RepID=UPI0005A7C4B4